MSKVRGDGRGEILTGANPMTNAHPGVHPDGEGSKWLSAKDIGRRPAAAFTENPTRMTEANRKTTRNKSMYEYQDRGWVNTDYSEKSPTCGEHLVPVKAMLGLGN